MVRIILIGLVFQLFSSEVTSESVKKACPPTSRDPDGDCIYGEANRDYPNFSTVPKTKFRCSNYSYAGYFADVEASCQVFHNCKQDGKNESFLCPKGSLFNQKNLKCDWWFNVRCIDSSYFYGKPNVNRSPYNFMFPFMGAPFYDFPGYESINPMLVDGMVPAFDEIPLPIDEVPFPIDEVPFPIEDQLPFDMMSSYGTPLEDGSFRQLFPLSLAGAAFTNILPGLVETTAAAAVPMFLSQLGNLSQNKAQQTANKASTGTPSPITETTDDEPMVEIDSVSGPLYVNLNEDKDEKETSTGHPKTQKLSVTAVNSSEVSIKIEKPIKTTLPCPEKPTNPSPARSQQNSFISPNSPFASFWQSFKSQIHKGFPFLNTKLNY